MKGKNYDGPGFSLNLFPEIKPLGYGTIILNIFYMLSFYTFMTNIAIVFTTEQIASPTIVGTIMSTFTLAIVVGAFVVGFGYGAMKKYFLPFTIFVTLIAFFILTKCQTLTLFFVAAAIYGVGFGAFTAMTYIKMAEYSTPRAKTFALSLFLSLNGLASFLSPFYVNFINSFVGIHTERAGWIIGLRTMTIVLIILVIFEIVHKPKKADTIHPTIAE